MRYDEKYSKESLEDKLDDRFIVRYSGCGDDGNLDNGGDEIIIKDKELVKKLNSMIEVHVQQNIENYKTMKGSLHFEFNQTQIPFPENFSKRLETTQVIYQNLSKALKDVIIDFNNLYKHMKMPDI